MTFLAPSVSLRIPDTARPELMRRRGWWLVAAGFLLPGSAQILAGNRKLGRVGIVASLTLLGLGLAFLILWFAWRWLFLAIVTSTVGLLVLQGLAFAYAVLWVILALDTLRLVRFGKVPGNARLPIALLGVVLMVVPSGAAAYGAHLIGVSRGAVNEIFQVQTPPPPPIDGNYTFLLLGSDEGADRDGIRPDSIRLITVNAENGAATMVGIPRNLQAVPFPEDSPMHAAWPNGFDCGDECLINAVYTWAMDNPDVYPEVAGSPLSAGYLATRDAVEGVTGVDIQFIVVVDMAGAEYLIDALGGITINVTEPIPIGITGEEAVEYIQPGEQVLSGYYALWYARSRAESTDYERMQRQQEVIQAIINQFTPDVLLTKFQDIAAAGVHLISTDMPQSMLSYLVDLGMKTRELPITTLELVPPVYDPVYPDYDVIHADVAAAMATAAALVPPGEEPESDTG